MKPVLILTLAAAGIALSSMFFILLAVVVATVPAHRSLFRHD